MLMNLAGRARAQRGFTLVEFMIAATISLVILAALTGAFVSSSRARDEMERANQQIENGRYAIQVLTDDLELAGFWSQYDIYVAAPATPGTKPDPCLTTIAALTAAMPMHIQGYDSPSTNPLTNCLSDVKPDTDILVVRHASTCVRGSTNCAAVAGLPYFQASLCSSGAELQSTQPTDYYRLNTDTTVLDRHLRDCTNLAAMRQYVVHIYYIANNDLPNDNLPTLKRAELGIASGTTLGFNSVAIAEGVENLQLEYGVDADVLGSTGYGTPDAFTADPDNYTAATRDCPTTPADCDTNWVNTLAVKINLLVRNPTVSLNFVDSKTYTLGLKADGSANIVGPFPDRFKRHAYSTSVRLNNVARRRET